MKTQPCPFCGATKIMAEGQPNWVCWVCQRCQAQGPKLFITDRPVLHAVTKALALWNKRKKKPNARPNTS